MFDAKYDLVTVKHVGNTSSIHLSFHQTLELAKVARLELIHDYVDNKGLDMDSGTFDSGVVELSMRPCNSLEPMAWDSVYTVSLEIKPTGIVKT